MMFLSAKEKKSFISHTNDCAFVFVYIIFSPVLLIPPNKYTTTKKEKNLQVPFCFSHADKEWTSRPTFHIHSLCFQMEFNDVFVLIVHQGIVQSDLSFI